jgi:hypothetical protein
MHQNLKKWLNQPYPFQFLFSKPYWAIGGLSIFIFTFLTVLQPVGFGSDSFKIDRNLAAHTYALIAGMVILGHRVFLKQYFNEYSDEENWTVGKEFGMYISILLTTGLFNSLASFIIDKHSPVNNYFYELGRDMYHTTLIGVIPIFFLNMMSYILLLRKNQKKSTLLSAHIRAVKLNTDSDDEGLYQLNSPIKKDQIGINLYNVLYMKSDGNYIDLFMEGGEKKTIRGNLQTISTEMARFKHIYQCHRSYLINLYKITAIKGNAMGYVLSFSNKAWVPVSRNKSQEFKELLRMINA